jgi:hypothetical protein
MLLPIEDEYEYRFTEYEYEFDALDTGDEREVSDLRPFCYVHGAVQLISKIPHQTEGFHFF